MRSSAAAAAAAAAATAAVAAATGLSDSDRSGRRSFASSHSSDSLGSAAATLEDPHQRGKERQQLERGSRRSVAAQQGSSLAPLRTSPAFLQDTDEAFIRAATEARLQAFQQQQQQQGGDGEGAGTASQVSDGPPRPAAAGSATFAPPSAASGIGPRLGQQQRQHRHSAHLSFATV